MQHPSQAHFRPSARRRSAAVRLLALCTLTLASLAVTGCVSTRIGLPKPNPHLAKLLKVNRHPLELQVAAPHGLSEATIGTQYLFFFIPMGRVSITDPANYLSRFVVTELANRDWHLRKGAAPKLMVEVRDIRASAYDALVTRIVSASVTLEGTFYAPDGALLRRFKVTREARSPERYGFEPQLNVQLAKASRDAAIALLDGLDL